MCAIFVQYFQSVVVSLQMSIIIIVIIIIIIIEVCCYFDVFIDMRFCFLGNLKVNRI